MGARQQAPAYPYGGEAPSCAGVAPSILSRAEHIHMGIWGRGNKLSRGGPLILSGAGVHPHGGLGARQQAEQGWPVELERIHLGVWRCGNKLRTYPHDIV